MGLGGAFGLILGMVGSCALVLLISVLASCGAAVDSMMAAVRDMADGGGDGDAAAVADMLVPQGSLREIASFTGGLILLASLMQPWEK